MSIRIYKTKIEIEDFLNKNNNLVFYDLIKNIFLLQHEIETSWSEVNKDKLRLGLDTLELLNADFYNIFGYYFIANEVILYYNQLWRLLK